MKRGRGRPPGTRNKATLIAQAKLLNKVKTAADGPRAVPLPNGNTTRVTAQHLLHSRPPTPPTAPAEGLQSVTSMKSGRCCLGLFCRSILNRNHQTCFIMWIPSNHQLCVDHMSWSHLTSSLSLHSHSLSRQPPCPSACLSPPNSPPSSPLCSPSSPNRRSPSLATATRRCPPLAC